MEVLYIIHEKNIIMIIIIWIMTLKSFPQQVVEMIKKGSKPKFTP